MKQTGVRWWRSVLAAAVSASAIFFLDLSVPLGVAAGVLYVAIVVIGWWFEKTRDIYALATIASVLTIAGFFLSPEGGVSWMAAANRVLSIFAVWFAAGLLAKAKHAEIALLDSEEKIRSVVNNLPAKIHIKDLQGRYVMINSLAEKLFGVTEEKAKGRTTAEIFPEKLANEFVAHDQAVLDSGRTLTQEEQWVLENSARTYLTFKFPIRDGHGAISAIGAIGTDITERKQFEEALRDSAGKITAVVNTVVDGIITIDEHGKVETFNPAAERVFGYHAEEVIGQNVKMLMPEPYRGEHDGYLGAYLGTGQAKIIGIGREVVGLRKDGSQFPMELAVSEMSVGGKRMFTGIVRDITERKLADEAVHAAKEEAEIANKAKSEFLATMSHELRTPLNAILGFSELIESETFGPLGNGKYLDYATDINDSGQHLLQLINDILDLSKVESGKDELHDEEIDILETVNSVIRLVSQRAKNQEIKLNLDASDRLPNLLADIRKLKQILVNLLSNAIKFTEAGGDVTLKIWCHPKSGYIFQIIDTGIGMAPEDIPKALSQFGQVDSIHNRRYQGTGLGLPLTKALTEQHGGTFDVQSQVGVGTTVTVSFPAERTLQSQLAAHIFGMYQQDAS